MWRQSPADCAAQTDVFSSQLSFSSGSRRNSCRCAAGTQSSSLREPSCRLLFVLHSTLWGLCSRLRIRFFFFFLIDGRFCLQSFCNLEKTRLTFLTCWGGEKKKRENEKTRIFSIFTPWCCVQHVRGTAAGRKYGLLSSSLQPIQRYSTNEEMHWRKRQPEHINFSGVSGMKHRAEAREDGWNSMARLHTNVFCRVTL